jgi:phage repressor protein C with HTH and peptisase S24 domain
METTLNRNIKKLIEKLGITPYEFSKQIGNKRADNVYNIINQKVDVSATTLNKIFKRYPEHKDFILSSKNEVSVKNDAAHGDSKETTLISKVKPVYLYDVSAAAGFSSFDAMITQERVVGEYIIPDFKSADWLIYVKGSSMYPKYSSGDIIACRVLHESRFIQWGKVYVIATKEQGMLVKRLEKSEIEGCLLAVSDNKAYGEFDIPLNEIVGIALVVGVIRME